LKKILQETMTANPIDLKDKAEKELNEIPSKRKQDIQALKDMINAEKDLRCPMEDEYLLRFFKN